MLKNTASKNILGTVEEVLSVPLYKESAERISNGFKSCSGAKGTAEKILYVARERAGKG